LQFTHQKYKLTLTSLLFYRIIFIKNMESIYEITKIRIKVYGE